MIMAGGLDGEISKLRHKDVRQRRRAVRVLFDTDLPRALDGFIPLLDDKDPWFRSKALDAHRRWAPSIGPSALDKLARHRSIEARRCAANLLSEFKEGVSEIAMILVEDADLTCRRKSAAALLGGPDSEDYVDRFLSAEDPYLRRLAVTSKGATAEQRLAGLKDGTATVSEAALQAMTQKEESLDEASLIALLERGINGATLIDSAVKNNGAALINISQTATGQTMKLLVQALKGTCNSTSDPQIRALLDAKQFIAVGRWLQGKRGVEHDALRWKLVREPSIDQIERSRWIERLLGRCDEDVLVDDARVFLQEDHPQLLLEAAQNLSTAFDKLVS
jgi:HEAT repeat protein